MIHEQYDVSYNVAMVNRWQQMLCKDFFEVVKVLFRRNIVKDDKSMERLFGTILVLEEALVDFGYTGCSLCHGC